MFIWVRNPHWGCHIFIIRQKTRHAHCSGQALVFILQNWCCLTTVVTLSAGSAFSAFLSHLIFVLVLFPLFPGGKFPPPSVHCQPLRLLILLWSWRHSSWCSVEPCGTAAFIIMGRFRKSGNKPACKIKLSSGELKFITDHTSFTEDNIKEWHKVNHVAINVKGTYSYCGISNTIWF